MNAIFFNINTYEEYDIEKLFAPKLFSDSAELHEVGVEYVLKSMTKDQIYVIKCIAKHIINNPGNKTIDYETLLDEWRSEINISWKYQLKQSYLLEAFEHKLVIEKKDENGRRCLTMDVTPTLINLLNI